MKIFQFTKTSSNELTWSSQAWTPQFVFPVVNSPQKTHICSDNHGLLVTLIRLQVCMEDHLHVMNRKVILMHYQQHKKIKRTIKQY